MTIHELRNNIDKIQKKIEVSRIDPGFDKQSLTSLYEKRQELFGYYHNFIKWQISQKVPRNSSITELSRKNIAKLSKMSSIQLISFAAPYQVLDQRS